MEQESTVQRPRRREYSAEFKGAVLEQCRRQGASVAGVALGHGLNPNMVHRWIREERQQKLLVSLETTPLRAECRCLIRTQELTPMRRESTST